MLFAKQEGRCNTRKQEIQKDRLADGDCVQVDHIKPGRTAEEPPRAMLSSSMPSATRVKEQVHKIYTYELAVANVKLYTNNLEHDFITLKLFAVDSPFEWQD